MPAPLTAPAPESTVGSTTFGSIPIPLTTLTSSSIPFLEATATVVLGAPTVLLVVVVVIALNSILRLLKFNLYPDEL